MSYVLEHAREAERLEYQAKLGNYQLQSELERFNVVPGAKILDAGCGSGLLSRYLIDRHGANVEVHACDASKMRLEQARSLAAQAPYSSIRFFYSDLNRIDSDEATYDRVVCRFVLEHLDDPSAALKEFSRILKPGGQAYLIDLDGILFNFHSTNSDLMSMLHELQRGWKTDLFVGRKLPSLLSSAGFKSISYEIQTMQFHGQDLLEELELTRQRLEFIRPTVASILGEKKADLFNNLYCAEMLNPDATLFYNKFIATGINA
jgi:ubiquinone/menaquinone biosynthesis C-methylase UbiE